MQTNREDRTSHDQTAEDAGRASERPVIETLHGDDPPGDGELELPAHGDAAPGTRRRES